MELPSPFHHSSVDAGAVGTVLLHLSSRKKCNNLKMSCRKDNLQTLEPENSQILLNRSSVSDSASIYKGQLFNICMRRTGPFKRYRFSYYPEAF